MSRPFNAKRESRAGSVSRGRDQNRSQNKPDPRRQRNSSVDYKSQKNSSANNNSDLLNSNTRLRRYAERNTNSSQPVPSNNNFSISQSSNYSSNDQIRRSTNFKKNDPRDISPYIPPPTVDDTKIYHSRPKSQNKPNPKDNSNQQKYNNNAKMMQPEEKALYAKIKSKQNQILNEIEQERKETPKTRTPNKSNKQDNNESNKIVQENQKPLPKNTGGTQRASSVQKPSQKRYQLIPKKTGSQAKEPDQSNLNENPSNVIQKVNNEPPQRASSAAHKPQPKDNSNQQKQNVQPTKQQNKPNQQKNCEVIDLAATLPSRINIQEIIASQPIKQRIQPNIQPTQKPAIKRNKQSTQKQNEEQNKTPVKQQENEEKTIQTQPQQNEQQNQSKQNNDSVFRNDASNKDIKAKTPNKQANSEQLNKTPQIKQNLQSKAQIQIKQEQQINKSSNDEQQAITVSNNKEMKNNIENSPEKKETPMKPKPAIRSSKKRLNQQQIQLTPNNQSKQDNFMTPDLNKQTPIRNTPDSQIKQDNNEFKSNKQPSVTSENPIKNDKQNSKVKPTPIKNEPVIETSQNNTIQQTPLKQNNQSKPISTTSNNSPTTNNQTKQPPINNHNNEEIKQTPVKTDIKPLSNTPNNRIKQTPIKHHNNAEHDEEIKQTPLKNEVKHNSCTPNNRIKQTPIKHHNYAEHDEEIKQTSVNNHNNDEIKQIPLKNEVKHNSCTQKEQIKQTPIKHHNNAEHDEEIQQTPLKNEVKPISYTPNEQIKQTPIVPVRRNSQLRKSANSKKPGFSRIPRKVSSSTSSSLSLSSPVHSNKSHKSENEQPLLLSSPKILPHNDVIDNSDDSDDSHSIDIPLMSEVMNQYIINFNDDNDRSKQKPISNNQKTPTKPHHTPTAVTPNRAVISLNRELTPNRNEIDTNQLTPNNHSNKVDSNKPAIKSNVNKPIVNNDETKGTQMDDKVLMNSRKSKTPNKIDKNNDEVDQKTTKTPPPERPKITFILPDNFKPNPPKKPEIVPILFPTEKSDEDINSSQQNFVEPTDFNVAYKFPTHFFQQAAAQIDMDDEYTDSNQNIELNESNEEPKEVDYMKGPNIQRVYNFVKTKPFFYLVDDLLKKNHSERLILLINPFDYSVEGLYVYNRATRTIGKIWGEGKDRYSQQNLNSGAYFKIDPQTYKLISLNDDIGFTQEVDAIAL